MTSELQQKLSKITQLLDETGLDGLWLQSAGNFAWATCGASSYINTASTNGLASLLITREKRYVVTTNIEAPRIGSEQGLVAQGWEMRVEPWYTPGKATGEITGKLRLGADGDAPGMQNVAAALVSLRSQLTAEEQERFRGLGRICADAMNAAARAVRPGMSEHEIAALLAGETEKHGAQAIVNLIATDERIFKYRHPLPTDKALDRYAMLVLCGRRHGLVCSITRLVHFGPLPGDVRSKMEATARVDATFIAGTRPGRTLGEVLGDAIAAYAATGYANEWQLHHQGGTAAYDARETLALPESTETVRAGQAYAWNPSITGTKSEDTILLHEDGFEIITEIEGWPMIDVTVQGQTLARPAILEVL